MTVKRWVAVLTLLALTACGGAEPPTYRLLNAAGGRMLVVDVLITPDDLAYEPADGELIAISDEVLEGRDAAGATVLVWCGDPPVGDEAIAARAELIAFIDVAGDDSTVRREGTCLGG